MTSPRALVHKNSSSQCAQRSRDARHARMSVPADARARRDDTSTSFFTSAQRTRECQARALCRGACELLNLPLDTSVTALTAVLRFYAARRERECENGTSTNDTVVHHASVSPEIVVPSAIYLACKLEESVTRVADVVNTTHLLVTTGAEDAGLAKITLTSRANVRMKDEDARELAEGLELAGYDASAADDGVIVGALYYEYKDRILELEQEVLQAMDYELNTEQPHKFMFHIVHAIGGGEALACAASAALLNMMFNTDDLLLTTDAPTLAAAAVHLSSIILKCEGELKTVDERKWYETLGFDFEKMAIVNERFLNETNDNT